MSRTLLIIISFFVFSSCSHLDDFPTTQLYFVDIKKNLCEEYALDNESLKINFVRALDLKDCPTVIGFTLQDSAKVMSWARRTKKKIEECAQ